MCHPGKNKTECLWTGWVGRTCGLEGFDGGTGWIAGIVGRGEVSVGGMMDG